MIAELTTVRGRRAVALAVCVLVVLVAGGRHLAGARAPAAAPIAPALAVSKESRPLLTVHVVGSVRWPVLYRFDEGSRVADSFERSGGTYRKAVRVVL